MLNMQRARTFKGLLALKREPNMIDFCCDRHFQDGIKVCRICKRLLSIESFYKNYNYYSHCLYCGLKLKENKMTKTYNNLEELKKDVVSNNLIVNDNIEINFNLDWFNLNIKAWDIKAMDINAWDIDYYAVCCSYKNIECNSIKGRRQNCKHFCLDGEITTKPK